MTWSAATVRNLFFSPVGGAVATFIVYRRRRLESLKMKNSFQNKKNICLFRYLNVNLLKKKTIENNYYVPSHNM